MNPGNRDPFSLARAEAFILGIALVPRTWLVAVLRPSKLPIGGSARAGIGDGTGYAPPIVFAAANTIVAIVLGRVLAEDSAPVRAYTDIVKAAGTSVLSLMLGNALFLALLGLLFRLSTRAQFRSAFDVLAYGSAIYVPVTIVGRVLSDSQMWDRHLWPAVSQGDFSSLVRLPAAAWLAICGLGLLSLLWVLTLSRGLRIVRRDPISQFGAAGRVLLALGCLVALQATTMFVELVPILQQWRGIESALRALESRAPSFAEVENYTAAEFMYRNIARSSQFTANQRYAAQQIAIVAALARWRAAQEFQQVVSGDKPSETYNLSSQLLSEINYRRAYELTLTTFVDETERTSSREASLKEQVRKWRDDLEYLHSLTRERGFVERSENRDHGHITLGVGGRPSGPWFVVWPHAEPEMPRDFRYLLVAYEELPGGRSVTRFISLRVNPMKHLIDTVPGE